MATRKRSRDPHQMELDFSAVSEEIHRIEDPEIQIVSAQPVSTGPTKRCTNCLEVKPLETGFYRFKKSPDGRHTYCKQCQDDFRRNRRRGVGLTRHTSLNFFQRCIVCDLWIPKTICTTTSYCPLCLPGAKRDEYQRHREQRLAQMRGKSRQDRLEMIAAYGGKCDCCGVSEWQFLTVDHIDGGGKQHIREIGGPAQLIRLLRNQGYPRDKYRLLCWNCNCARSHRGVDGVCPHQIPLNGPEPDQPVSTHKRCPRCGIIKEIATEFFRNPKKNSGPYCKPCSAAYQKERRHGLVSGDSLPDLSAGIGILKHCPACDLWKVASEAFDCNKSAYDGWQSYCRICAKSERPERGERELSIARDRDARLAQEVMTAYGWCCQCCGLDDWRFLTIDHIYGDGAEERQSEGSGGLRTYKRLKRLGFPRDRYRCLCYNCNCAIGMYGQCPHQNL